MANQELRPPTVMDATRTVGMPCDTGTPCPSLPHVQPPSSMTRSSATMSTFSSTFGPLPMMFTSRMGFVSFPSSIKKPFLT